jgi:hypothetical protein
MFPKLIKIKDKIMKENELTSEKSLRRTVLSCLLWEDSFYEDGESISQRIEKLSKTLDPSFVANLAIEARQKHNLRKVPQLMIKSLIGRDNTIIRKTLSEIIQRPDEITSFLKLYWSDGKKPIPKQVKLGLGDAFHKFNEYQLAKWDKDVFIKLRDVLFLTHPKPISEEEKVLWNKLANKQLETPLTWEVGLSLAKTNDEKKKVWELLLKTHKLGTMALLKNLRNMEMVSVDESLIIDALLRAKTDNIFPYRFLTPCNYVSNDLIPVLEQTMFKSLKNKKKLRGTTNLLVDVSGSMSTGDNNVLNCDKANGLAILLREVCDNVNIYTFSNKIISISNSRGFALKKEIVNSQIHGNTFLGKAIKTLSVNSQKSDRLIVITDEQSTDIVKLSDYDINLYIINVSSYASAKNISYGKETVSIDGFSEAVIDWIIEYESININREKTFDLFGDILDEL